MGLQRSVYYYQSIARDNAAVLMRMKEITQTRVHYGYRRVHVLLRREGFKDNHKRIYRLYRAEGMSLRYKRPKRNKAAQLRQPKGVGRPDQSDVEHVTCPRSPYQSKFQKSGVCKIN